MPNALLLVKACNCQSHVADRSFLKHAVRNLDFL
ncbi:MAG: hypothetical protein RLZZ407_841 [Pseudomonadota bacterium]|jgi:hypothetical protein